ncbi:unnamed protein product [Lymnaea stagnalis]|uniref:CHHC U11-48K-type domain-containing protein n=1 Tax=Lymnaea stagnalis TaxID=6523 RepID=A0AAV2IDB8_LYMST
MASSANLNLIECPYDPGHMISPIRMPYHLYKCRKNFPLMEMVVCPFNGFHEVQKAELKYHMLNCPDKTILERDICFSMMKEASKNSNQVLKGCTELPPSRDFLPHDTEEDWDSERNFESFSAFSTEGLRHYRQQERRDLVPSRPPMSSGATACISSQICKSRMEQDIALHNPSIQLVGVGRARTLTACAREVASIEPKMADLMSATSSTSKFPHYRVVGKGRGLAGLKISD